MMGRAFDISDDAKQVAERIQEKTGKNPGPDSEKDLLVKVVAHHQDIYSCTGYVAHGLPELDIAMAKSQIEKEDALLRKR